MKYGNIMDTCTVVDDTCCGDDPYNEWDVRPENKFICELRGNGFSDDEIYDIDIRGERGILVDYNLLPHERLWWDDENKVMRLKMVYTSFFEYRKALLDLGVLYDRSYWDGMYDENNE